MWLWLKVVKDCGNWLVVEVETVNDINWDDWKDVRVVFFLRLLHDVDFFFSVNVSDNSKSPLISFEKTFQSTLLVGGFNEITVDFQIRQNE